jgi:hypothetical protein
METAPFRLSRICSAPIPSEKGEDISKDADLAQKSRLEWEGDATNF